MFRNYLKFLSSPLLFNSLKHHPGRVGLAYTQKHLNSNTIKENLRKLHTNTKLLSEEGSIQNNGLIVDDKAQSRLKKVLEKNEALRIGVKGGGCSGFEYQFEIVSRDCTQSDEDLILCDGLVIIDKESLEYMSGATLEYEEELIRSGFKISKNPLAEKGCGCGASFSLKF